MAERQAILQDLDIVEPTSGAWRAPMIVTFKKDGKPRIAIDYYKVNKLIVKDVYPLPHIDEIFDQLSGSHPSNFLVTLMKFVIDLVINMVMLMVHLNYLCS